MRGNVIEYMIVRGEEYRGSHVLFIIDLVRNVEQCFHMADLQEGQRGRGGGIHCVTLNWWYTVTLAGGRMVVSVKNTVNEQRRER